MTKLIIGLMTVLSIVGCGKDSNSAPYLFRADLERVWTSNDGKVSQADFSNLNAVVIYGMSREGISSDCTYGVTRQEVNTFYGSFNFTYVSGEAYVCSLLVGEQGYELVKDTSRGEERLSVGGYKFK